MVRFVLVRTIPLLPNAWSPPQPTPHQDHPHSWLAPYLDPLPIIIPLHQNLSLLFVTHPLLSWKMTLLIELLTSRCWVHRLILGFIIIIDLLRLRRLIHFLLKVSFLTVIIFIHGFLRISLTIIIRCFRVLFQLFPCLSFR